MKDLKKIIDTLESMICSKVCEGTENIDTHEFYEVADIYKDFVEACYKKTIIEAMEKPGNEYGKDWNENGRIGSYKPYARAYSEQMRYPMEIDDYRHKSPSEMRIADHANGMMYYTETSATRNPNEGMSGMNRRTYMEHKSNNDESENMRNLEDYFKSLKSDIMGMTNGMSGNEKQLARQKLQLIMQNI